MQPSPPCPTCGGPLRWFPEHNAWGCDRERKLIPAASAMPQQPMPHQPMRAPRAPRTPAQKKKLILIAAIAGVVVAGGVVAFLLLKGGDDISGGASSPEELAKRAAAAISGGKVDELTALNGMANMGKIASCHFADDNQISDRADIEKHMAKRHMGVKLEVKRVEPEEDDKPKKMKAGRHLGDSCWLTRNMQFAEFDVTMKDGSDVEKAKMSAIEIDGHWFFAGFDDLPKGKDWDESDDEKMMKFYEEMEEKRGAKIRKAVGTSPESAIKGMVDAAAWRSRSRARAIAFREYGSDFEKLFSCTDYSAELKTKLETTSNLIRKWTESGLPDDDDFDEGGRDRDDEDDDDKRPAPKKNIGISVKSVKSTDKGKFASGDDVDGCKIQEAAEWEKLDVEIAEDGEDGTESMTAMAIKVDDVWRILYFREA